MTGTFVEMQLTGRQLAILAACLRRCKGWDDPRELERFLNVAADQVSGGFTETEMHECSEVLAATWNRHLGRPMKQT